MMESVLQFIGASVAEERGRAPEEVGEEELVDMLEQSIEEGVHILEEEEEEEEEEPMAEESVDAEEQVSTVLLMLIVTSAMQYTCTTCTCSNFNCPTYPYMFNVQDYKC